MTLENYSKLTKYLDKLKDDTVYDIYYSIDENLEVNKYDLSNLYVIRYHIERITEVNTETYKDIIKHLIDFYTKFSEDVLKSVRVYSDIQKLMDDSSYNLDNLLNTLKRNAGFETSIRTDIRYINGKLTLKVKDIIDENSTKYLLIENKNELLKLLDVVEREEFIYSKDRKQEIIDKLAFLYKSEVVQNLEKPILVIIAFVTSERMGYTFRGKYNECDITPTTIENKYDENENWLICIL